MPYICTQDSLLAVICCHLHIISASYAKQVATSIPASACCPALHALCSQQAPVQALQAHAVHRSFLLSPTCPSVLFYCSLMSVTCLSKLSMSAAKPLASLQWHARLARHALACSLQATCIALSIHTPCIIQWSGSHGAQAQNNQHPA